MDYLALWQEIDTDPAVMGYAGKSDGEIAALLNGETQTVDRTEITGAELLENTDLTELVALDDKRTAAYWGLVGMAVLDIAVGSNARSILTNLFAGGTTTRANMVAFVQIPIAASRASIIGWARVYVSDIVVARDRHGGP